MPKARRSSYNLAFKSKIMAEGEAIENNSDIARKYGISESMVRHWRKDQARRAQNVSKTKDDGLLYAEVS